MKRLVLRLPTLKLGRKKRPPTGTAAPVAATGGAPGARLDARNLLIVTDQGEQSAWWAVDLTSDTIEEVPGVVPADDYIGEFDPPPRAVPVLSFSAQDFTAPIKRKELRGQITARFERNEGMKVEILPRGKSDTLAFGAPGAWIDNFKPQRVFPGTYALHLLLKHKSPTRFPAVTGFLLQRADAPLLILFQLEASGQLSHMAYVPRAGGQDEIALALKSFADEKGIALTDGWLAPEQLTLFSAVELASVVAQLRAYPTEPSIGNVPVRRLWNVALAVCAVGCVASVAWAGTQRVELASARSDLDAANDALASTQAEIETIAATRFERFVGLASIDPIAPLLAAQAVYTPGAKVELLARRGAGTQLTVSAVASERAAQHLHAAPNGCRKEPLSTTSNANVIQAQYECSTPGFDFSGLFGVRDPLRLGAGG